MREEREYHVALDLRLPEPEERPLDRRLLVAHAERDHHAVPEPRLDRVPEVLAVEQERRAPLGPDFPIRPGRSRRPHTQD